MLTTSTSLLQRLQQPNPDGTWGRFVTLYTPFLIHLLRHRLGASEQDIADLVQDIFLTLLRRLPGFRYDPAKGPFRGYLRQVCASRVADQRRKRRAPVAHEAELSGLEDSQAEREIEQIWQEEHNRFLTRRALELMRAEFQPNTWKACWEFVVHGRPAAEIAVELGISVNAVFVAKCRVVQRLKQELEGLLEE